MQESINSYLNEVKQKIDQQIEASLKYDNPLTDALIKSAAYSAAGGKRIRAVFTYLVGELFDVDQELLWTPACAIELVHAASLIMDDLPYMEDSQLRRGKPANHVVFGQDVALLASVGLIAQANSLVLADSQLSEKERMQIAEILSDAYGFNGLVAGQFVDLKLKRKDVDFSIIEFINRTKTTALFSAAGRLAIALGNAGPEAEDQIVTFAEKVGFAFQIAEEIENTSKEKPGKGLNLHQDQLNLVELYGMEESRKLLTEYRSAAEQALESFGSKADKIRSFVDSLLRV